jgi:hypothetical protein
MKFDPNEPAYPPATCYGSMQGFTKREALIKGIFEHIISSSDQIGMSRYIVNRPYEIARVAIRAADALISEINGDRPDAG